MQYLKRTGNPDAILPVINQHRSIGGVVPAFLAALDRLRSADGEPIARDRDRAAEAAIRAHPVLGAELGEQRGGGQVIEVDRLGVRIAGSAHRERVAVRGKRAAVTLLVGGRGRKGTLLSGGPVIADVEDRDVAGAVIGAG